MKKAIYFLLILVAILSVSPIFAAQFTVGAGQKYITIQSAVDAANSGDTIIIRAGEYKAATPLLTIKDKKNLKIIGQGVVRLVCTNTADLVMQIINSEEITIQNVKASHFPVAEGCAEGVLDIIKSKKVTIDRCELNGCGTVGIWAKDSEDVTITNNYIHSNTYMGISINACKKVVITGNTITRNFKAVSINKSQDVKFVGNRVFGNRDNQIIKKN